MTDDTYQAVYDAVRSKISNGDISYAIQITMQNMNLAHYAEIVANNYIQNACEQIRPSTLLRPKLSIDGNKWCALYGENLQEGVAGFGDSPALAMQDFDNVYNSKLEQLNA